MQCPNCGLFNPESALRCDCGYGFVEKRIVGPSVQDESNSAALGVFWGLVAASIIGAAGSFLAFTYETYIERYVFVRLIVGSNLAGAALGILPVILMSGVKFLKPYGVACAALCGTAWISAEVAANHGLNAPSIYAFLCLPPVVGGLVGLILFQLRGQRQS